MEKYTTLRRQHTELLAEELAKQNLPIIVHLEPITDFEELLTFEQGHPTPIGFTPRQPAWRLESVAARVYETIAIAAHESLEDDEWDSLAGILLEYTEYLYTYPDATTAREKLDAGTALALASSVCSVLPHAELWRLAGFGRIASAMAEGVPSQTDSHLTHLLSVAFSLAIELNLPILDKAIESYNTVFNCRINPKKRFKFPVTDTRFFHQLNLELPGLERVKSAVLQADIDAAKAAYTVFRRQFLKNFEGTSLLERTDTYSTAKSYLACLLRLCIYPSPVIAGTIELSIAALLFPEFRRSEQLSALALRRYKWIAEAFFCRDGFHRDRTFRTQCEAIVEFSRYLRLNPPDAEELKTFLEKQMEACLYLSQPDLSFPTTDASTFDAIELCQFGDIGFGRDDFEYIASARQRGSEPHSTSYALPETGYYVMRDSWESDAQYLLFDAGPLEMSGSADVFVKIPRNLSRLSFLLHAHGRQLVEGCLIVKETAMPEAFDTRWITTPAFDFIEVWHKVSDIHYKRSIFYIKGEYFILHDLVLGEGERTLEQIFQFLTHGKRSPNPQIVVNDGAACTQAEQSANLFLGCVDTTNLTVKLGADKVTYRVRHQSPTVLNVLLFPMKPDIKERPTVSPIAVSSDTDVLATGFTVKSNGVTDTFLISDDGLAAMSTDTVEFVGESLFLRGEQFIMLNGRFLKVGGKVFADLGTPREHYVRMK